jgi:hypothetical protein
MNDWLLIVVAVGVVAANALWIRWHCSRSRAVLERWAAKEDLVILHSERRLSFTGLLFLTDFKSQAVFRVKVRDHNGKVRSGLVTCGSWLFGVTTDEATVAWEGKN